jgi:hypothetical protein
MLPFEIMLSVTSIVIAAAGLLLVHRIIRTSGRDRPRDPARVQRLVDNMNSYNTGEIELSGAKSSSSD